MEGGRDYVRALGGVKGGKRGTGDRRGTEDGRETVDGDGGRERGTGRDGRGSENESDLFRCPPALFRRHLLRGALNLRHFNYSLIFESNLCRRFKRGFIRKKEGGCPRVKVRCSAG